MVFLLRMIVVLLGCRFRRRITPLEESVISMRVWPNDLDLNHHMNSGRYVTAVDIGRLSILVRLGIFRKIIGMGWRPIAGGTMIRYKKSLLPFERFQVRSRVMCWDDKWFYFEHIVERGGELCALAHVRGLLRGPRGNVPPAEFLATAGSPGLASPPMPEFIRLWNEAEALR